MHSIGKTIKLLRQFAGLRQGELATMTDVSSNYISLVENQKREPSLKFLQKASEKLDIPISAFFWNELDVNGTTDP